MLLLAPSLAVMVGVYVASLVLFGRYAFYEFTGGRLIEAWTVRSVTAFFRDGFYWDIIGRTLGLSVKVTVFTLLASYPLAYYLARIRSPGWRNVVALITFAPLLVSVVVRSYGWLVLLSPQGLLNWALMRAGVLDEPARLIFNETGVVISLVHILLPFMTFPIVSVLVQMDPALKDAAQDLGANPLRTFWYVTLPLTLKGVAAGVQIVFTLCLTTFVIPALLGGGRVMTIAGLIYQKTVELAWPIASTAGVVLILLSVVLILGFNRVIDRLAFDRN
jgi:putative spermidine/putrescine transport system permease protein